MRIGRGKLVALVLVLALALPCAESTKKPLEDEVKLVSSAVDALTTEIEGIKAKAGELTDNTAELGRIWRVLRNQQAAVDETFRELSSQFSSTWRKAHNVTTVNTDESAQLQGLFFGGLPYLVQCVGPSDPLHRAFSEAAPKLVKEGVIPVAVDCGAKMPSGKTIYDRFFAGKDVSAEPFFFLVANKDAPRHLAITPNKQVAAESLVRFAVDGSAPQVTEVTSAELFKSQCIKKKTCAIFMTQGEMSSKDRKIVDELVSVHRRASFLIINSNRFTTTFDGVMPPPSGSTPRLVFMRQEAENSRPRKSAHEPPPKPMWEAKAFRGDKWSKAALSGWLEDAITGYLPLTTLKTNPNVFDPNAYKGAHNNPSSSDRDSIKDKGSGGSHPKERDTSHYAANLQYHKERAEREAEEKKKGGKGGKSSSSSSSSKSGGKGKSSSSFDDDRKREGGGFKTKAKVSKEEQAAAARDNERKRRERMERDKAKADGIEFVGGMEDEPDEDGYYHLDAVDVDDDETVQEEL